MAGIGIGHNSMGSELSPDDQRRLFFDHYRKIASATEKVKAANEERKKLRKLAKVDGIVLADVDFGLRCAEIEDSEVIVDELRRRTQIAAWMALPVEFQSELFGNEEVPTEDRAYDKGRLASSVGKSADPRIDGYDQSTPQGQAWLKGHADDQARARDELQSIMEKRNAAAAAKAEAANGAEASPPKSRGRPKGAKNKPKDGSTYAEKLAAKNAAVDESLKDQATEANASTH